MVGRIRGTFAEISLTDSTLVQEVSQIPTGFAKGQFGQWGSGPSGPDFRQDRSFSLRPSFADRRGAGARGKSDPCPLLVIDDFVNKPTEVSTVDPVKVILFVEVCHRLTVPEINGSVMVCGHVRHRLPFFVVKYLFHGTNALPEDSPGVARFSFLTLSGMRRENNRKLGSNLSLRLRSAPLRATLENLP